MKGRMFTTERVTMLLLASVTIICALLFFVCKRQTGQMPLPPAELTDSISEASDSADTERQKPRRKRKARSRRTTPTPPQRNHLDETL